MTHQATIGHKILQLEEVTSCSVICPSDALGFFEDPVMPTLSMLRYSRLQHAYGCDMPESVWRWSSNERTAVEDTNNLRHTVQNNRPPLQSDIANNLLLNMKENIHNPDTLIQTFLSVKQNPQAVMTHAVIRIFHANRMLNICRIIGNLGICPKALEGHLKLGFLLPSVADQKSSLHGFTLSVLHGSLDEVQHISSECGVFCGIWALAVTLKCGKDKEKEIGKEKEKEREANCSTSGKRGIKETETEENMRKALLLDIKIKRNKNKISAVTPADIGKVEVLVNDLKDSPFEFEMLLDSHRVACCSLMDLFGALIMALGPRMCQRAAAKLAKQHTTVNFTSSQAITLRGTRNNQSNSNSNSNNDNYDNNDKSIGRNVEARDKARREALKILRACGIQDTIHTKNKNNNEDDDDDNDDDAVCLGSLCFNVGSDGISSCPIVRHDYSTYAKTGEYVLLENVDLDYVKEAILDGCMAVLSSLQHDELRIALSLPVTALEIYNEMQLDNINNTTINNVNNVNNGMDKKSSPGSGIGSGIGTGIRPGSSPESEDSIKYDDKAPEIAVVLERHVDTLLDLSREALWNLPDSDKATNDVTEEEKFLDQKNYLVSVKVVALFHLWQQLRTQSKLLSNNDTYERYDHLGNVREVRNGKFKGDGDGTGEGDEDEEECDYIQVVAGDLAEGWAARVFCKTQLTASALYKLFIMLYTSSPSYSSSSTPGPFSSPFSSSSSVALNHDKLLSTPPPCSKAPQNQGVREPWGAGSENDCVDEERKKLLSLSSSSSPSSSSSSSSYQSTDSLCAQTGKCITYSSLTPTQIQRCQPNALKTSIADFNLQFTTDSSLDAKGCKPCQVCRPHLFYSVLHCFILFQFILFYFIL